MKTVPVLWIDLDGTVRWGKDEMGHFVNRAEDVRIFDEVPAILAAYRAAGWRIVAISNQGGVAMGLLTQADMEACLMRTYQLCGGLFDKMCACVHHPDAPDPMMGNCWCRKPRIGMLVGAGNDLSAQHDELYPPHLGLFVGDRPEDEGCAQNAGLNFMGAAEWRGGGWEQWL